MENPSASLVFSSGSPNNPSRPPMIAPMFEANASERENVKEEF